MEITNIVPQKVLVTFSITDTELSAILDAMDKCILSTSDTTVITTFKAFHAMLAAAEEPIKVLRQADEKGKDGHATAMPQ